MTQTIMHQTIPEEPAEDEIYKERSTSYLFSWVPSIHRDAKAAVKENPKILKITMNTKEVEEDLRLHNATLFLIIFCSILQASFLGYVRHISNDLNIGMKLYFVRIFSDLLSRPSHLLFKKSFLSTIDHVYYLAIVRAICMCLFFMFIFTPKDYFYRNDYILLVFQVQHG